jgi:Skp family chaperone for outer membrane proteins
MFRRIIAGTAVAGALTLGLAGAAGAATGSTGNTGANAPAITSSTTVCSLLPTAQARVQKLESKLAADLPKAQAAEAKAKAAGHTKLADRIAARITKAQNRETKVNARLAKLQAECGTGGTSAG